MKKFTKEQKAVLFIIGYCKLKYDPKNLEDMKEIDYLSKVIRRYINVDQC